MADVEMMVEDERPDFLDYLPTEREDSTQEGEPSTCQELFVWRQLEPH